MSEPQPLEALSHTDNLRFLQQHPNRTTDPAPSTSPPLPLQQTPAKKGKEFLESLINKTLRVSTRDTRMFVGQLRCTDKDRNLILSLTHEYRMPNINQIQSSPKPSEGAATAQIELQRGELETISKLGGTLSADGKRIAVNLQSRFLGLVVVPGEEIVKIEVEERVD